MAGSGSFCEWKGPARYWDLVGGERRLARVAWSYPQPLGAEPLAECIAFYAHDLDFTVGGAKVLEQPGGFLGGWITPELTGPFKASLTAVVGIEIGAPVSRRSRPAAIATKQLSPCRKSECVVDVFFRLPPRGAA